MNTLLTLLAALCVVEFIHNNIEIWGMQQKVSWLSLSLLGKPHGKWPINVNTKFKTVLLHGSILFLFVTISYLALKALDLSDKRLVLISIILLLINYICTTWRVDIYHNQIGNLINKAKNR